MTVRFCWAMALTAMLAMAQETARPESVGMNSAQLERLGAWLDGMAERKEAAGFVSLVARRGQVVWHKAHGARGLSNAAPMPVDALFDLASMTKPVTVAAALMLLEEGRFALNDPVERYLPEFARGAGKAPIRVRHLFSHTSGVHDTRSRAAKFEAATLAEGMRALAKMPLGSEPGSAWLYGDSHDVLGYLVEKVSGQPLDQFVQSRILGPLRMKDTAYWPPAAWDARRAVLVVNGKDDPESLSRVPPAAAKARSYIGGASGLYSTAADYWRFAQMLLDGGTAANGGARLLGPRTIAYMAQNHIGDMPSFTTPGTRFGLGLAVVTDPAAAGIPYSAGTYYWSGSQGTLFWIDPKEELIGVLMVQLTPSTLRLRERFSAMVYAAIDK
ncbi:MAG: beta-lactamase family protein [Bryobacterales bacterium]|nr:beta-lactamase family protein [Bryobacterales bacterium]